MYLSILARRPGKYDWERVAIDDLLIDVVRPSDKCTAQSRIYDQDDILQWEVNLSYWELVAMLNDTDVMDVPEPPMEPKTVEAWMVEWGQDGAVKRDVFTTLDAAESAADWLDTHNRDNITLIHLKGERSE